MRLHRILLASACLLALSSAASAEDETNWTTEIIVPGSAFHGVHGLAFDAEGNLYAGSVVGQTIDRVNVETGEVTNFVPLPEGMADDIAFAPDGTMAWTSILTGEVRARFPDGTQVLLASGLPGANSLAFTPDNTLYVTQVFFGDGLWRMQPRARIAPVQIAADLGGLNGFEIGPDGMIYGPIWFKSVIARVDPATGAQEVVADGFKIPAAANFGPDGKLYAIDTATGELWRIDVATGEKSVVTRLLPAIDNLAIRADGMIFVSNMADNSIEEVNPETGATRLIVKGALATTGGIAMAPDGGVLVADNFAVRKVNGPGEVETLARMWASDMEYASDIAISADGATIIVTSFFGGSVQLRDAATFELKSAIHHLAAPMTAIDGGNGWLYVAEAALSRISRVPMAGGEPESVASEVMGPSALALSPDGTGLYVVESSAGRITHISFEGLRTTIAEGLQQPEGLAVDLDGSLIVTEVGRQCVVRISLPLASKDDLACDLPMGLPAPMGMPPVFIKSGVALAPDGTIYVAGDRDNSLIRLVFD